MWESRKRGIFSATPRHRFFRRRTGTSIRQWDKRAEAIGPLPVFFQLRNMDKRIQSDTGCLPCSQQEIFHIRQVCRFHPMFCTGIRIAVPGMESSRAIPVYAIEDLQQEQDKHCQNRPQSTSPVSCRFKSCHLLDSRELESSGRAVSLSFNIPLLPEKCKFRADHPIGQETPHPIFFSGRSRKDFYRK